MVEFAAEKHIVVVQQIVAEQHIAVVQQIVVADIAGAQQIAVQVVLDSALLCSSMTQTSM